MTDFTSQPVRSDIPVVGSSIDDLAGDSTTVPVPADYRVHGLDLNIGIGYALLDDSRAHLWIGINSGLSLPFMRTRNMGTDANLVLDVLRATSTEIRTLKLGPTMAASWQPSPMLTLRASWTGDHQWGRLDNTLLDSGIDIDGGYSQCDLSIELHSKHWPRALRWLQNGHVALGYHHSRWKFDTATFNLRQASVNTPATLDMAFTQETLYAGIGIDF
jgi:hypothetical protein